MTTNIDLAKEVAKHVQLHSIFLKSANLESSIDHVKELDSVNVSQQHRCGYSVARSEAELFIRVLAEFQFVASSGPEGELDVDGVSADVAKLDAAFVLTYVVSNEVQFEERCLRYFADVNGAYNAWPYWRELVQTATGRIGLGGVMVPVYRPAAQVIPEPEDGIDSNHEKHGK